MKLKIFVILLVLIFPSACNSEASTLEEYYSSLKVECQQDSDCKSYNVGNCCGAHFRCLSSEENILTADKVDEICGENQIVSICLVGQAGNCVCKQGKCAEAELGGGLEFPVVQ